MLAIHTKSGVFHKEWIEYCAAHCIPFKEVDCFSSDIIEQVRDCQALLWHWEHNDYRAALFARQLIASIEAMGLAVFPNTSTCWHYDDKVGQKYLLEALGAPLVPSHVFYDRQSAQKWLERAQFPVVWKLRGGAGSRNVRLVGRIQASRIVRRSFSSGWKPARFHSLQERIAQFRSDPNLLSFISIGRGVWRVLFPHVLDSRASVERHYVYFQDFIQDNDSDIRVVVIGERAFAIKRMVREGDFRASGSGRLIHDPSSIPTQCVSLAFGVAQRLNAQCVAFDFMFQNGAPVIGEISYAFSPSGYLSCPGWWGPELTWHEGAFRPEHFMVEDVLAKVAAQCRDHG